MLNLTQEEKILWGKRLREPKNLPFTAPEGYLDCVDQVQRKEFQIMGADHQKITVWLTTTEDKTANSMLYLNIHGGGFVQQHAVWDHALCAIMAKEFRCAVLDVDYRLAPEYPFPAALNDCYDVLQWVYDHAEELDVDPDKIVIGGNSAGATLSAGVCMKSAEKGTKMPNQLVMIYPAGAMEQTEGVDVNGEIDLGDLSMRAVLYNNLYLESDDQTKNPYVSLIYTPGELLEQLPDAVVITAGKDPLCPGGEQFAMMMAASGSRIVLRRFRNSGHGFYLRCIGDEWQEARKTVFEEIRRKMNIER